jgi:twitching motility two-component system response regulator PilG
MVPPSKRNHIMVIDDSKVICRIIEGILEPEGYKVASFGTGPEALQALTLNQLRVPDLVMLDIQLPLMDGYSVAKLMKQRTEFEHTVIVMVSGNGSMFDRARGKLAGAKAYITKPFKPGEILSVVQHLLDDGDEREQ